MLYGVDGVFGAIPNEIEEAAAIDGAGRLGPFFRMVVPLSLPGVVTVGICPH